MKFLEQTNSYVVRSASLEARLNQRAKGNKVRAIFGVKRDGKVFWGTAASIKEALVEVKRSVA